MNQEMLKDHFLELLRPIFQKDADLSVYVTEQDIHIQVYWFLQNDPHHHAKHSRPIRIKLENDLLSRYSHAPLPTRNSADQQLYHFVKEKLDTFNPDHDFSKDTAIPEEEWTFGKQIKFHS